MSEFYCILTTVGAEKLALAAAAGVDMAISYMAVGDGGGSLPAPDPAQQSLLGEQYRAELNSLRIFDNAESVISAEMVIPPEFGGFWIREVGLYSDDGALVAVGNLPPTYKPRLIEGSGRTTTVRTVLAVSSTGNVRLLIDPTVVVATISYVDEKFREAKNRADDAYRLAEGKANLDDIYPPGISVFFAKILDPNEKWPGTLWYQLDENKTIRLAKADGSDVMETGGRDSITIARANLPKDKIDVSGGTSEHDTGQLSTDGYHFGIKRTSEAGGHTPKGRYTESNTSLDGGNSDRRSWSVNYDFKEEGLIEPTPDHAHTVELEDHHHTIPAIRHTHSVTAKTEQLGQGVEINIVNSYITLYGWYRAA